MRHLTSALGALMLLCSPLFITDAEAQNCSFTDIWLTSQAEIDSFQTDYGPCDTVEGSVRIESTNATDLDGLSALTSVGDSLIVLDNPNLTNLNGLSSLTSVGRDLDIAFNNSLANLDGLSALTSVGEDLNLLGNNSLANLDGLSALTSVGGRLLFRDNNDLTNLDGLSSLTSVGTNMFVDENPNLTNLDGLSALTSVGGNATVRLNDVLADCSGLGPVLGWPTIPHDPTGDSVGGNLTFEDNDTGANSPDDCLNAYTPPTVGGTVSGLSGAGLVLQNNAADDLGLNADGAFNFATGQLPGTAYAVTVATQPTGQTCAVSNDSGTMPGSDVTDVLVECRNLPVVQAPAPPPPPEPIPVMPAWALALLVGLLGLIALPALRR